MFNAPDNCARTASGAGSGKQPNALPQTDNSIQRSGVQSQSSSRDTPPRGAGNPAKKTAASLSVLSFAGPKCPPGRETAILRRCPSLHRPEHFAPRQHGIRACLLRKTANNRGQGQKLRLWVYFVESRITPKPIPRAELLRAIPREDYSDRLAALSNTFPRLTNRKAQPSATAGFSKHTHQRMRPRSGRRPHRAGETRAWAADACNFRIERMRPKAALGR